MGCALLVGQDYFVSSRLNLFEFFLINLLATLSLLVLVSATDLLPLYLSIEMQSLSFYILASFNKYSAFSTEAGLKYFVLGAFVSGFFLFGSSLLYGATGSTNFFSYSLLFSEGFDYDLRKTILLLGIFFLLIVFLFKISAAPFHIWSPDVYEGAPLSSTLVFVLVPKLVLFLLIFRLLYFSFPTFLADFQPVLLLSGVLSVLLGSLMAIRQKRLKRLLVYSSISHVGFLLLGCASGTVLGLTSILYYIIFYIITNTLVWGVLALMHSYTGAPVYLSDLSTLSRINPALAITFCLGLFSLAGIPPLVGFSMKFFIFHSAMSAALYPLSWLILMLSAVGSFYYLRIIKIVYFE
jgi:NADH-quinone oxidoreductase subunit N